MPSYRPAKSSHDHAACGHDHSHEHAHAHSLPPAAQASPTLLAIPAGSMRSAIRILQMDCPTEESLIRAKLQAMPAVHGMEFNLMQRTLTVAHRSDAREPILAAIRTLGFEPQLVTPNQPRPAAPTPAHAPWWPLLLAGAAALAAEAVHWAGGAPWLARHWP
jgi:Cd2+/Zn2+-exporting ATPase